MLSTSSPSSRPTCSARLPSQSRRAFADWRHAWKRLLAIASPSARPTFRRPRPSWLSAQPTSCVSTTIAVLIPDRCVDLQQLSTALLPIITSPSQVDQMAAAWDQLDMKSIADQCALSCSCEQDTIEQVLLGFRDWLEGACDGRALERLGAWVSSVLDGLQTTKADEGAARS